VFTGESVPSGSVIIADPPYGISHPCNFKTRKRGNLAECSDYADVAYDDEPFDPAHILALDLPTVLWGGNHYSSRLPDSGGWLVWDKKRPDDLDQATCELAWTNFVKGVRRKEIRWHGMLRAGGSFADTLLHPTQKPVALTTWILGLRWTPPGLVIDLYAGSGSALVAAKRAGRHYLGFELSKDYCEIAERWLENPFAQQGKYREDTGEIPSFDLTPETAEEVEQRKQREKAAAEKAAAEKAAAEKAAAEKAAAEKAAAECPLFFDTW
jgi:hypothetical protein